MEDQGYANMAGTGTTAGTVEDQRYSNIAGRGTNAGTVEEQGYANMAGGDHSAGSVEDHRGMCKHDRQVPLQGLWRSRDMRT